MHEMQTIVTDVRGVCLSVCLSCGCTLHAMSTGSFGAAFVKSLWPLAIVVVVEKRYVHCW